MKRALSIDDLLRAPVGRFNVGATHLVWCHSPTLCGTVHWGRPTETDANDLVRRLEISVHPSLNPGLDTVRGARGLESFDWDAFTVLSQYLRARLPEWSRRIRRHAVLVP